MSERSQKVLVWWALAFTLIYGVALGVFLDMIPTPSAQMSVEEIGRFYENGHDRIRVGAVIASWTSAFLIPLVAVLVVQMGRQEAGRVWTVLTAMGGAMMSIFLVLPPLFWGVAAYTLDRDPAITALMHELGTLTLTTTDQYYIFMWVGIAVMCFQPDRAPHSPFPRWFGYFTIWTATMFEAGAFAFLPRTGPFAWNGVLVFWSPLTLFGSWIGVCSWLLLRALRGQQEDARAQAATTGDPATGSGARTPAPAV